jgi:peptide subunit release factor 1 (eRF1)
MIGQEELKELLAYDAGKASVVSLYLDADTTQQTIETIKLQARTLLREANGLDKDTSAIEHYLDFSFDWGKPGLALFSCAEHDFFRDYPVAVSFRNRIRISPRPHVKPITHLMDHYAHYGVIVVDRIGARFFDYHLGELQDSAGTMGDDVRKQKHGGGSARGGGTSSATGQRGGQGGRHEEAVVQRNLRETAAAAEQYFSNKPIRRLFLGGTAENVAQFRELLSKKLQSRLAGTFPIDMTAGEHEVRQRSLELLEEANTKREGLLVQNMITTAAKGGNAVTGLDNTLQTVSEGRVQTLVVSDGYRAKGFISEDSQILASGRTKMDALSEEKMVAVEDIIEEAVTRTMGQGGSIEIISDNSDLEEIGRIGAILRY